MPLTRRQQAAIPFLVTGATVEAASRESGIPAITIRRWLRNPEFQDLVDAALKQRLRDAINSASGVDLSAALGKAIRAAEKALGGRSVRNQLQAARLLWDIALRIEAQKLRSEDERAD